MKPSVQCQAYRPAVCSDRATTLALLVRIQAPRVQSQDQPSLNLGLAIDRSGSMAGEPMVKARQAAINLVQSLDPGDLVSAVSFDHIVEVVATSAKVSDQKTMVARLESIEARGWTDLHQGWLEAAHQVQRGADPKRINRVVLLSDGQTNQGLTCSDRIANQVAQWQSKGISTTAVGLGLDYNEDLLAGMAEAGNGNFYHIQDPAEIASLFQVELHGLSRTYGRSVSLGVDTVGGVELLRVFNSVERNQKGALRVGDLVHGCPLELVFEFLVPAQLRAQDLCRFRLRWTAVESGKRRQLTHPLRLPVVPHGQLSEFPVCEEVLHKRALQLAGLRLKEAVALIDSHDKDGAKVALQRGVDIITEAGTSPELEAYAEKLKELLADLQRGANRSVRKQATYASSSMSRSSIVLSGGVREFMKLPVEERTAEKLQELMGLDD